MPRLKSLTLCATLVISAALTGCSDSGQSALNNINDLKYTGNARTDGRNLCKVAATLNDLDNTKRAMVQTGLVGLSERFSDSNDPKVTNTIKGMKMATSLDQDVRAKGNDMLRKTCGSI